MELSVTNYDFAGWATCSNKLCSDGRTILPDAFKHHDGEIVPLVWNHQHNDVHNILGKALLHSRDGGLYAYCMFNDTESGQAAKKTVLHGDICSLSICANQLKQDSKRNVSHGKIREVSLVVAGANPGALIDSILTHDDGSDEEAIIYSGEEIVIHSEEQPAAEPVEEVKPAEEAEETKPVEEAVAHAEEGEQTDEPKAAEETIVHAEDSEETVEDVINTMNEKQQKVFYAVIGKVIEDAEKSNKKSENENPEGGNETMKQNVFDNEVNQKDVVLTHADKQAILALAKQPGVASLKSAIQMYVADNETLAHAFDQSDAETVKLLFPEPHLVNPGAPEIIRDAETSWVMKVINKIKKSPFAKIRTRKADARGAELKAKGYQNKGDQKTVMNQIKLLSRTTEPQTVYIKAELHRDDIIDITDFDIVAYQWNIMKDTMYETLATAVLIGDGREEGDPDKIHETNIRSIWHDDEFYCMHVDVDIEKAKEELQGSNTSANFGENYIYAEAMITASLYSREKFKGSGTPTLYCTPHLVNVMLLARDLNGRRIYDSKADLAKALNVAEIVEIEQLEGKVRETDDGNKKLLGLFVNLADYQFGSAKGGELTKFDNFDIDFNKYKYLMETRLSGSLVEIQSAIALEEPVA